MRFALFYNFDIVDGKPVPELYQDIEAQALLDRKARLRPLEPADKLIAATDLSKPVQFTVGDIGQVRMDYARDLLNRGQVLGLCGPPLASSVRNAEIIFAIYHGRNGHSWFN